MCGTSVLPLQVPFNFTDANGNDILYGQYKKYDKGAILMYYKNSGSRTELGQQIDNSMVTNAGFNYLLGTGGFPGPFYIEIKGIVTDSVKITYQSMPSGCGFSQVIDKIYLNNTLLTSGASGIIQLIK